MVASGQDLFAERQRIKQSLESSINKSFENGAEAAEKTMAYRILKAQETARLRVDGTPMTIIETMVKGEESVARAEFEKNIAEVKYRASLENIMAQKILLKSIESDIERELGRSDAT